ncbi:MAG: PepSY domain-containing protein [Planctomycetaceae bacterium]|nr:PepSY domain-containing protein [Planctomycetaceae bacterium]
MRIFHWAQKIISLFPVLYYGRILGLPTKIIYFLACLIATTLPITGVIIWWRKLWNLHNAKNNQRSSASFADEKQRDSYDSIGISE